MMNHNPASRDPFSGQFELACTFVCPLNGPCQGRRIMYHSLSAGWVLGNIVEEYSMDPNFARCPLCKRHIMKVVKVPEEKPKTALKGFTEVPEE